MVASSLRTHRFWQDFDWPLLGAALVLSLISLTEIYSSTMNFQSENYFMRQFAWVLVGLVSLFVVSSIDYHTLSEHVPWIYLGSVSVLLYTLVFGKTVSGSKSWLSIFGFGFQPSEIIKMVVVVALARFLS